MSRSISSLIPELRPFAKKLLAVARAANVGGSLTSARRTTAEQARLYQQYQEGLSKFPAAPPGKSAHEVGMAFDFEVPDSSDQSDLGQVWESWGGVWGGRFHPADPIHFEYPGFVPTVAKDRSTKRCSPLTSGLAQAVDFVLGFVPGIGEVELVASLVALGFPRSSVLAFLSNPVSSTLCGTS